MQRFELISQGCDILDEVLLPHRFNRSDQYEHTDPSITGGGPVVVRGGFERSDRRLEVEVWLDLRRVVYHVGGLWLEHVPYMEALGVVRGTNEYPGFSADPLDGFRQGTPEPVSPNKPLQPASGATIEIE